MPRRQTLCFGEHYTVTSLTTSKVSEISISRERGNFSVSALLSATKVKTQNRSTAGGDIVRGAGKPVPKLAPQKEL